MSQNILFQAENTPFPDCKIAVFCMLNQKFMKSVKDLFLKRWVTGALVIYPGALGLLHPLIAHGFTGDHGKLLTTPQFIMHTLSLFVFISFLAATQNRTFQVVAKRKTLAGIWPFLFVAPWAFWLGYYTLFVPFDILFMFLSIGIINAIQLKPLVKFPGKWVLQCILGYLLAAIAGIAIGLGAYLLYYQNMHGIARDFATWLSISTPAALVVACFFRYVLKKQVIVPEGYAPGSPRCPSVSPDCAGLQPAVLQADPVAR
jgi:NADH:ubiquinone oxidoreductase subunit K